MCSDGLVYNFEVEGNHTYLADGLVAHNCHMLTKEAQNALLALFESPPDRFLPILCTTDSTKILPTIKSRCSTFFIKPLSVDEVRWGLKRIFDDAGQPVEFSVLFALAQMANGSLRDVQQIADQLIVCADGACIHDEFALNQARDATVSLYREVAGALSCAWVEGAHVWFDSVVAMHSDGMDMRMLYFQVIPTLLRDLRIALVSRGYARPVVPYDSGIDHEVFQSKNRFSHEDLGVLFQAWDEQAEYFGQLNERANVEFFFLKAWDRRMSPTPPTY